MSRDSSSFETNTNDVTFLRHITFVGRRIDHAKSEVTAFGCFQLVARRKFERAVRILKLPLAESLSRMTGIKSKGLLTAI